MESSVRWGRVRWAAGLALFAVVLRLLLFDYRTYFELRFIPNHDMQQGASLFATSMHSMRLSGDIAWWNPAGGSGYAQYYQELLSPLAPTLGHVVFIVWAELVFALGRIGVAVPEYFQYLTVTFIVLPFLATLAFALLCGLLFRARTAVAAAVIVFTLSSIGLWHSAWFYFQEPATMLFLLAAAVAFFRQPRPQTALLALAAGLVQLASFNYWTLFNSWFIAIFLGSYVVVHPTQLRRAGRRLWGMVRRWPWRVTAVAAGTCVVGASWIVTIAVALREQSAAYERTESLELIQAVYRLQPLFYLGRMFEPDLDPVAVQPGGTYLTMHHAVYLGAFLLPLLVALPFYRLRRLERCLLLGTAALLPICFAALPVRWAWEHVPWMNNLRHLFLFYPAYVRLIVVLLGCACLDRILMGGRVRAVRAVLAALVLVGIVALYRGGPWTGRGPVRLIGAPEALLVVIPATAVAVALSRPSSRNRALLGGVIVLVALVDLGTYFRYVSRLDGDFTASWFLLGRPLPPRIVGALKRPWAPLDPGDPEALFYNLPFKNQFWPINTFMPHVYEWEGRRLRERPWGEFVGFHPRADPTWMSGRAADVLMPLPHEWRHRDYNSWSMVVDAPEAGWLSLAQLHDPAWRATVDGRPVGTERANVVRSAVPIDAGRHEVAMEYRPLSRRLYWPASAALELFLLGLGVTAWKVGPAGASGRRTIQDAGSTGT
jgi:hypothetical protein